MDSAELNDPSENGQADTSLEVIRIPFLNLGGITLSQRWRMWWGVPRHYRESMLAKVPTIPGRYLDGEGHDWTLNEHGRWVDRHGRSEHPRYNWVLGSFGLARIPS